VSFRVTAALLAVLIILGGAVYYSSKSPAPETGAAPTTVAVMKFTATDAVKLVIAGTDKTTELEKKGDAWGIVRPAPQPADSSRVESWVDQIANLSAERSIDDVTDLASYGLASPRLNVEVDMQDGKLVKVQFGDKTPDGGAYYVRLPDDGARAKSVYLIGSPLGDDLTSALTKPPVAVPTPTPFPTLVPTSLTPPSAVLPTTATPTPGG
jgi:hypothetical protein